MQKIYLYDTCQEFTIEFMMQAYPDLSVISGHLCQGFVVNCSYHSYQCLCPNPPQHIYPLPVLQRVMSIGFCSNSIDQIQHVPGLSGQLTCCILFFVRSIGTAMQKQNTYIEKSAIYHLSHLISGFSCTILSLPTKFIKMVIIDVRPV